MFYFDAQNNGKNIFEPKTPKLWGNIKNLKIAKNLPKGSQTAVDFFLQFNFDILNYKMFKIGPKTPKIYKKNLNSQKPAKRQLNCDGFS